MTEADSQMESRAANASDKEISIQWYLPSLAKPTNDTETKEMAIRCLSEVRALLSAVPVPTLPLTEIPFDITLQSIATLEDMFDLANGCTITEESLFSWIVSLFH
ncbi:hypothetical protein ASZ78_012392 [Callipepla squamata]|uniref:Uncharacterized protein n=1 Tax=Callipepla squamata TaxID=9009 RepID=A0A226MX94_CALSU|nr:hypothetical protein ASZ78_012392 [Callipepla squamata]